MNIYYKFAPNVFLAKSEEKHEKGETIIVETKHAGFLSLGEPIKVGHHSERGHRRLIEQAHRNMDKSIELSNIAEKRQRKAKYWANRTDTINLSMPDSIDFYEHKLEVAKDYHEGLKSGKYPREHMYSLTYAKKELNEAQKNYTLAVKMWGDD